MLRQASGQRLATVHLSGGPVVPAGAPVGRAGSVIRCHGQERVWSTSPGHCAGGMDTEPGEGDSGRPTRVTAGTGGPTPERDDGFDGAGSRRNSRGCVTGPVRVIAR